MKAQLSVAETAELLPNIQAVLTSGLPWKSDHLHHPALALIKAVLSIRGMKKKPRDNDEGFHINGRQWDWWQHFEHDGKGYVLSGSGYYGGHTFRVAD